ncbi:MAG: GSCFA family protein [Geobacter sp.]|nr:MAG: GSCFA family protein [Geobacter sp.]
MAIEIVSAEEAWGGFVKSREYRRWPTREKPDRLYPVARPEPNASFRIDQDAKVFCVGSCFVREIEQAIKELGFDVLSIVRDLPESLRRKTADAGMFNKYTPPSILNEINWAMNSPDFYAHDRVLVENSSGLFEDYQLAGDDYADNYQDACNFRNAFNRAFAGIKFANLIVLTLGLVEAWFDKQTCLYLNKAPSRNLIKKYPGRFELRVLDYDEIVENLEEIYRLLQEKLHPDFKMLVTVSPVPLKATFRRQDVLSSNMYSKSVLRAAVEQFIQGKPRVDYFPSYEFVALSDPDSVWNEKDFRHVNRQTVDRIMSSVLSKYSTLPGANLLESFAKIKSLYAEGFFAEAESLAQELVNLPNVLPSMILRAAMIKRRLKKKAEAILLYERYLHLCPTDEKTKQIYLSLKGTKKH